MANEESSNTRFLKTCSLVSLPNCKFPVPSLTEHISKNNNRSGDKATLVSNNGKIWHVDLNVDDNRVMYMCGDGWRDFALAHGLEIGCSLVFRYKGYMVFSFRAFDLSGSEKNYCSLADNVCHKEESVIDLSEDENSGAILEQVHECDSERKCQGLKQSTGKKKMAYGQVKSSQRPYFETTIHATNLNLGYMHMPTSFIKSIGLTSQDIGSKVYIRDPNGSMWLIGLACYKCRGFPIVRITTGFTKLARANQLKVGDRVGMELVSAKGDKNKVMHFKMCKM